MADGQPFAPEVWAFYLEADRGPPTSIREVQQACRREGLPEPKLCKLIRIVRTSGRVLTVVSPADAKGLYRVLHTQLVAVLATVPAVVLTDPGRRPDEDGAVPLKRYCWYKGFYGDLGHQPVATALSAFATWRSEVRCAGERDPRCLPLHLFDPENDCDLDSAAGVQRFERLRGRPTGLRDCRGAPWPRDHTNHGGREREHVAGVEISLGMHWDMQADRREERLPAIDEVYRIARGGHVNVYPNAVIRGGKGARRRPVAP